MKITNIAIAILAALSWTSISANDLISKSPEGAKVYFINLEDGQTVGETFHIQFGLAGMGVAPAGINMENTGHHHLLVNADIATIDFTRTLPATEQIRHFGKGQTEMMLSLPKGEHTLQLLLGNYLHIPHDKPVMSEQITVMVK